MMGIDTDKDQEITSTHTRSEAVLFVWPRLSNMSMAIAVNTAIMNYKIPHLPPTQAKN